MFEKEAEEYADKQIGCGDGYYEWTDVEQAFKDGAEFGYNFAKEEIDYLNKHWRSEEESKTNEWHYVKDGDYPKGKGAVLIYWKSGNIKCASVVEPYKVTEDTHIIAWKEIVLPELKECE